MDRSSQFGGINVFIGCAPKDQPCLEQLRIHLMPLEGNFIRIWDETSIQPGAQHLTELQHMIVDADIAVLLISADFLASPEIAEHVLPLILERARSATLTILSVIVGFSAFQYSLLAPYKPINSPEQPLNTLSEGEKERVWQKVAQAIRIIQQGSQKKDVAQPLSRNITAMDQAGYLEDAELVLDTSSLERLADAILHAYPSTPELKLLTSYGLYENIEVVAAGSNLTEKVHNLVLWATSHGKARTLIEEALKRNPGNPKLRAFAREHGF